MRVKARANPEIAIGYYLEDCGLEVPEYIHYFLQEANLRRKCLSECRALPELRYAFIDDLFYRVCGGRNSSVGSAWARCPQRCGFDPPLGTFSVEGIFPLELTWVQTPFPKKLLRMRV